MLKNIHRNLLEKNIRLKALLINDVQEKKAERTRDSSPELHMNVRFLDYINSLGSWGGCGPCCWSILWGFMFVLI